MATIENHEPRVDALEKAHNTNTETLEWMAGTLGRIKATTDLHTGRFNDLDNRVDRVEQKLVSVEQKLTSRMERVEHEVKRLRDDLPGIVAAAMREVLGKSGA